MKILGTMIIACALTGGTAAKVVETGQSGFAVAFEADVKLVPADAYAKFLEIGQWWSSDHSYSGDAKNMTITTTPGGCWCEAVPGGFVRHLEVVNVQPGAMLVLNGGLGPLQMMGVAGSMVVTFEAKDGGTHVALRYSVGGFDPGNFSQLSGAVDGVIGAGFESYQAFAAK